MIRITAHLIPQGLPEEISGRPPVLLGEITIANVGGTATVGNYEAQITKARSGALWKSLQVTGFRRKRFGVWYLLAGILKAANFTAPDAWAPPVIQETPPYLETCCWTYPGDRQYCPDRTGSSQDPCQCHCHTWVKESMLI